MNLGFHTTSLNTCEGVSECGVSEWVSEWVSVWERASEWVRTLTLILTLTLTSERAKIKNTQFWFSCFELKCVVTPTSCSSQRALLFVCIFPPRWDREYLWMSEWVWLWISDGASEWVFESERASECVRSHSHSHSHSRVSVQKSKTLDFGFHASN